MRLAGTAILLFIVASSTEASYIEGYTSRQSYRVGDTIEFHVSTDASSYTIDILRDTWTPTTVEQVFELPGEYFPVPQELGWLGAGWPVTYRIVVPQSWQTGSYRAKFCTEDGTCTLHPFCIRAPAPGLHSTIAVVMNYSTRNAYNRWGGKSLYYFLADDPPHAVKVSFQRPFAATSGWTFWDQWDLHSHLEAEGFAPEYITELDIHRDPRLLFAYDVVVFSKHHEYISRPVYDAIEAFHDWGGHLAFFSANDLWWQVRYEDDGATMVCYKGTAILDDPEFGVNNHLVTTHWRDSPLNRPGETLQGVRYESSSYLFEGEEYIVQMASHWILDGTGLSNGDVFGELVANRETDYVTDRSPPLLDIILEAHRERLRPNSRSVPPVKAAAIYYAESPVYGFLEGRGGQVFSAGCEIGWCEALRSDRRDHEVVRLATRNIIWHMVDAPPTRECYLEPIRDGASLGGPFEGALAAFVECLNGPDKTPNPVLQDCVRFCLEVFDLTTDGAVDLSDYAEFERLISSSD